MNRSGSILVGALAILLTFAAANLPSATQVTPSTAAVATQIAPATTDNGLVSMEPVGGPVQGGCECTWPEYECPDGLACKHQPFNTCGQCVQPH